MTINDMPLCKRILIYNNFEYLCAITSSSRNYKKYKGFPGGSDSKESACNAGDQGSIPGSGRSPGEGNGYPLQYSCLEKSTDRGAWQATLHGVAKSQTQLMTQEM